MSTPDRDRARALPPDESVVNAGSARVARSGVDAALVEVVRREHALIVAHVRRLVGDLDLAEEIAQEAALRALESWREKGVPQRPGAWLLVVARRQALDGLRRARRFPTDTFDDEASVAVVTREPDNPEASALRDDLLRLFFTCCHPVLPREAQVALALRELAGLRTPVIARAFLVSEPAIAQRLVRAKRALRERDVAYRIPTAWELGERLPAVLEVIYLVFNAGYSPADGEAVVHVSLCDEAIRLGTLLAEALPASAEALGLLALMELQSSRERARTDTAGKAVLLEDQDRAHWDHKRIDSGLAHLERARQCAQPGALVLQAEIAACHARATTFSATDWPSVVRHYSALQDLTPSPVVALNRAVAIGMANGPAAGLRAVEALSGDTRLGRYAWFASARGEFLARMGRHGEAAACFSEAAALCGNEAERAFLERRRGECDLRRGSTR